MCNVRKFKLERFKEKEKEKERVAAHARVPISTAKMPEAACIHSSPRKIKILYLTCIDTTSTEHNDPPVNSTITCFNRCIAFLFPQDLSGIGYDSIDLP